MEAKTLVDTLADTLLETNVETIGKTHGNVKSEELNHTLTDTLENVKTGRIFDKLANKKAKALLAKACDMLTVAQCETLCNK